MAGIKRNHDDEKTSSSPFMPMFETFRNELDSHHDRRERIIKASRDITALSKKIIFALQRSRTLQTPLPASIISETDKHHSTITTLFETLSKDMHGLNAWRYQRQISPGIQEYIEAMSFSHYLTSQTLIPPSLAAESIPGNIQLTSEDYVLGIFDLVGEMMRFAITTMATAGSLPTSSPPQEKTQPSTTQPSTTKDDTTHPPQHNNQSILTDLRTLRTHFETLDTTSSSATGSAFARDVDKKMEVMKTCVEKVETAVYGLIIRGRERPKGWMPDLSEGGSREAVESF